MSTMRLPLPRSPLPALGAWWARRRSDAAEQKRLAKAALDFERSQRSALSQIVGDLDLRVEPDTIVFTHDGRTSYARSLAVSGRPEGVTAGELEAVLFGLGVDASVALDVAPIPKNTALGMLNAQRTTATSMGGDALKGGRLLTQDVSAGLVTAEGLAMSVYQGDEALFGVTLTLTLRAAERAQLDRAERLLRTKWRGGLPLGSTRYQQRAAFLQAGVPYPQPTNTHRWTTNTSTLSMLWPCLSKRVGTPDGGRIAYALQDGLPVYLNPWQYTEEDSEGWNAGHGIIPAPNGGGKTVAAWTIIVELLTLPIAPQVVIVDPIKGDFRKGVKALGGQVVYMSTRPDISLNPLDLPPATYFSGTGEEERQNAVLEQTRLVTGLLLMMTGTTGNDDAEALFEGAVLEAYHNKGISEDDEQTWTGDPLAVPLLADVVALLGASELSERLRTRLNRWLSGTLSGLLSKPTSLDVTGRLISFDLERTDPRMKPVAVWLISNWVWQQAKRDRSPRLLYLEEVKTLLEVPETARMVAHLYSLGRGYKLAVVSATQLGTDYDETQEGRRARENAAWTLLLRQSKGAEWACASYGLGDSDRLFLETCKRGEGILHTTGNDGTFGRVQIDPAPYTLELIGGPPAQTPEIGWEA